MSLPGFSAEASLYKSSRHYRVSRRSIILPIGITGAIYPAAAKQEKVAEPDPPMSGHEIIIIEGEAPEESSEPVFTGFPSGHSHNVSIGPLSSGDGGIGQSKPPRRLDIGTLGQGPDYKDLSENFICRSAGVGAVECHLCNGEGDDYGCACVYCIPSGNKCTQYYDCTKTYEKR